MSGWPRRRWLWLLAGGLALAMAGMLTLSRGGGWLRPPVDETWARCQREGVLRVGMDASFPPFELEEDGTYRGYDVDLAQEIARRLSLRVEFVNVSFDGLYDALASKRCDVLISALPYEAGRTRDVSYTGGYFNAGQVVITRQSDTSIGGYGDLGRRTVAVEMGSQAHQEARRLRDQEQIPLTIQVAQSSDEALDMVQSGQADAAIADAVTARSALRSRKGLAIRGDPFTDESFVIAVRRDSPALFAAVNGALIALRAEGWLEAAANRWL